MTKENSTEKQKSESEKRLKEGQGHWERQKQEQGVPIKLNDLLSFIINLLSVIIYP